MLRFDMDVLCADVIGRTIEGVIVPYNEIGRIQGRRYRFLPGSVKVRGRTPLLVDHDRGKPIGVLAALDDTPAGAVGTFRIDPTPAGDEALAQAASGSRGALSIGASVEASSDQADGVIDVSGGVVHEVSLLALGAFDNAQVRHVVAREDPEPEPASEPEPEQPEVHPDQTTLDEPAPAPEPEDTMPDTQPVEAAMMIAAREPAPAELTAGGVVIHMIRAQHGDTDSRRFLEAALTESGSTALSGLLPPQYERTVLGGKQTARPLYQAFGGRSLPAVGLQVNKPKWSTLPVGAWAATVDADPTSSAIVIDTQSATVIRWDWAGEIPWVVVQRSDPSVIDEIFGQCVENFYLAVEQKIGGEVLDGAPGTSTTLGAGVAEFYTASGGRTPDVIIAAPDVWGKLADAHLLNTQAAAGTPSAGGTTLTASFGGIPITVSGTLAVGQASLATRRAIDARVSNPVRLTANAIGALNVQLAAVGEGLFDTDYPAELLLLSGVTPGTAEAAATSPSKSK